MTVIIKDIVNCEGCDRDIIHLLPANEDGSVHPSYMSAWDYKLCADCAETE